ncbi:hypothetical protein K490DRAFT_56821 [Saccharata proteae CBS 121410]|uniref:Uncharacterized protein n=1 Tax=Saccharata proteae CBS 121410 TaxID=1314787 RepID=A0A9P4LZ44_9PEZI|nr:hypothetical protein K490DRAFT_56821 [Saccharata proteae CBS 121410]
MVEVRVADWGPRFGELLYVLCVRADAALYRDETHLQHSSAAPYSTGNWQDEPEQRALESAWRQDCWKMAHSFPIRPSAAAQEAEPSAAPNATKTNEATPLPDIALQPGQPVSRTSRRAASHRIAIVSALSRDSGSGLASTAAGGRGIKRRWKI